MGGTGCAFCAIAAGDAAASIVHADEYVVAFMDIRPLTPGHVVVIPRRHAVGLTDLDPDDGARMFRTAQRVAAALRRGPLRCEGVNLLLADGDVAGQEVFHVHLYVVPRSQGDGFELRANRLTPTRTQLDDLAAMLRDDMD